MNPNDWTPTFEMFKQHLVALPPLNLAINAGISATILLGAWFLAWGLGVLLDHMSCHIAGLQREKAVRKAMRLTHFLITLAITVIALIAIAAVWGFDLLNWISEGVGQKFVRSLLKLFVVLILTAAAFEAIGIFVTYLLLRVKGRQSDDPRRLAQFDTLGPILRRSLQMLILVIGIMTFLGQLGVQIAPLLAGAGVVGIAIGFGAQTLVKDFFTGFFLLIEDVVAVGDVVTIASSTGEIENMTLRYISLRDFDGTLHVFPYGEAQIIHNLTKTFSYFVFDLPVAASVDVDKAITLICEAAADLRQTSDFGPLILAPVEVAGVDYMADFGVLIKSRIRTQPQERWKVGRELNRRIKKAFDASGIVLGHKGAYAP